MAPPGIPPGIGYRMRRLNPLVPAMRADLARMNHADADRVRAYQDCRLRALVRFAAARSPFYRRWFREFGVDPASIRTVDDLPQLPLLERAQLAGDPNSFLAYPRKAVWPARSTGTSGTVVTVYRSLGSSIYEMCALERQWGWFGLGRDPRRITLRGSDTADRGGALTVARPGTGQLLVSSFHLEADRLPEILAAMRAHRPVAVEGWPSSLVRLASLMVDAGQRFPVQGVITSSEMVGEHERALFADVFGGSLIDHYGQTERVAMAGTCEHGSMHWFDDYGVVELIPVPGRGAPRDRRHRVAQLGVPAAALPHRRRGDRRAAVGVPVRTPVPAPRPAGRPGRGRLHRS